MAEPITNQKVANLVHTISSHSGDVNWVSFSGQYLASSSGDKTIRLWKTDDFNELPSSPLLGHLYHVHCCVFSPFGTLLASCSTDGKAILWDAKSGEQLAALQHPSKSSIRVCRFSSDSSLLATGSEDETFCLWNVATRSLISIYEGHESTVTSLAFSPDSSYIISGCTNGVTRLWDARYGQINCLHINLDAHDLGVTCCEFSPTYGSAGNPDSMQRVFLCASCGNDNLVKLWDVISAPAVGMSLRSELSGHEAPVMACCFSPDGKTMASASGDKTVRLWNPLKGDLVHVIEAHTRYVTCCAFSPSGRLLATGSNDRTIKLWKILSESYLSCSDEIIGEDVQVDLSELNIKRHCEDWSVEDVCEWVKQQSLEQYCDNFCGQEIDGKELLTLVEKDLEVSLKIKPLGHRKKLMRGIQLIQDRPALSNTSDTRGVDDELLCPITREIMKEPVIAADGYTYERIAILAWFSKGKTNSPMTNAPLLHGNLTPNRNLKMLIQRHLHG